MRAHVGTYCRRRQYKQSRNFIPGTLYVIGWQYVPRVPSYKVAGKNMCRGYNICHHRQAAKFNSFISNYELGACRKEFCFIVNSSKKMTYSCIAAFKRSTGFSIYTYESKDFNPLSDSKHLVYHHNPMSGCPSPVQNVTVNSVTQGIMFYNERPSNYTSNCLGDDTKYTGIELCEVQVMGMILLMKHDLLIYFFLTLHW